MTSDRLREAADLLRGPTQVFCHPGLADPLADLLDDYANALDCLGGGRPGDPAWDNCPALRLSDAILGGETM